MKDIVPQICIHLQPVHFVDWLQEALEIHGDPDFTNDEGVKEFAVEFDVEHYRDSDGDCLIYDVRQVGCFKGSGLLSDEGKSFLNHYMARQVDAPSHWEAHEG